MSDLANHFALSPFSLIVVGYHLRCVMEWHGTGWSSWTGSFDVGDDDDDDADDDGERVYHTNVYHFLPTLPVRPSLTFTTECDDDLVDRPTATFNRNCQQRWNNGPWGFLYWRIEFNDDGWTEQQSTNQSINQSTQWSCILTRIEPKNNLRRGWWRRTSCLPSWRRPG